MRQHLSALFATPSPVLTQAAALDDIKDTAAQLQVAAQAGLQHKAPHRPPSDLSQSPVFLAQKNQVSRATLQALAQTYGRVPWNILWLSSPEFMNV